MTRQELDRICHKSVEQSISLIDINDLITAIKESDDFQASELLTDILSSSISNSLAAVLAKIK